MSTNHSRRIVQRGVLRKDDIIFENEKSRPVEWDDLDQDINYRKVVRQREIPEKNLAKSET